MYTARSTAKTIFPSLTFFLSKIFLDTIPTLNPAESNLFLEYAPGISAVSPPIRSQLDILQPLKIPFKIFLVLFKQFLKQKHGQLNSCR